MNPGSSEVVSVNELVSHIVNLSGKKIEVGFDLSGPQGTHRYCAGTSKMEKMLGRKPQTPFMTGLRNTFYWATRILVDA